MPRGPFNSLGPQPNPDSIQIRGTAGYIKEFYQSLYGDISKVDEYEATGTLLFSFRRDQHSDGDGVKYTPGNF